MSTERVKTNSSGAGASGVQKLTSWAELECINALGGSTWSSDLLKHQPHRAATRLLQIGHKLHAAGDRPAVGLDLMAHPEVMDDCLAQLTCTLHDGHLDEGGGPNTAGAAMVTGLVERFVKEEKAKIGTLRAGACLERPRESIELVAATWPRADDKHMATKKEWKAAVAKIGSLAAAAAAWRGSAAPPCIPSPWRCATALRDEGVVRRRCVLARSTCVKKTREL